MSSSGQHIIQKLLFELHTNRNPRATQQLTDRVSRLIRQKLSLEMDKLFSKISPHRHIVIDKLEINLGRLSEDQIERQMIDALQKSLQKLKIKSEADHNEGFKQTTESEHRTDLLWYFLKKGRRPWFVSEKISSREFMKMVEVALRNVLENDPKQLWTFLLTHIDNKSIIDRTFALMSGDLDGYVSKLVPGLASDGLWLFRLTQKKMPGVSDLNAGRALLKGLLLNGDENNTPLLFMSFLFEILKSSSGRNLNTDLVKLRKEIIKAGKTDKKSKELRLSEIFLKVTNLFYKLTGSATGVITESEWMESFEMKQGQTGIRRYFLKLFASAGGNKTIRKSLADFFMNNTEPIRTNFQKKSIPDTSASEEKSESVIMLDNAGIVLFWPFLKKLFKTLELIYETNFIDRNARQKAVMLLNYISYGESEAHEERQILNRVLCGYPLNTFIDTGISITDSEKEECKVLMKDVIHHWEVLKNTSEEGLRQSFILRTGSLKEADKDMTLTVDRKSIDVLKDKLPWSVSVIKLPWMDQILNVKW